MDCPMGCGKTSAAISYMNSLPPYEKVLYAAPYNTEAERIYYACPDKRFMFVEAGENKNSKKTPILRKYVGMHGNIACTHQLLPFMDNNIIKEIQSNEYTLIIDEAYDVLRVIKASDYRQFYYLLNNNHIVIDDETGRVSYANGFEAQSCVGLTGDIIQLIASGYVYYTDSKIIIWEFPIEVLNAFKRIIVMTYRFETHPMYYYMRSHGYNMNMLGAHRLADGRYEFCSPEEADSFRFNVRDKIHILYDDKRNAIGEGETDLSAGWYERNKSVKKNGLQKLKSNIAYVQRYAFKCSWKDFLWTCFKGKYQDVMLDGHNRNSFVPCTQRASNEMSHTHYLAYGVNMYNQPSSYNYFKSKGYTMDNEAWSLSSLLQWIWRSAIRNGEEIWIYIPSRRMRNLLEDWINEVSEGGGSSD